MADTTGNSAAGTLSGLRVLDLTGRMGGYCGLLLANLGAEVILVEPPGGDPMRRQGPFKDDVAHPEASLSFIACHTNKRGIVLDLHAPDDRERLRELIRHADALIEDKPDGELEQLGLAYASLRDINPALVMTSISGFGRTGPYRAFAAPHIVAFAMGGLMSVCGHPEKPPLMGPPDTAYRLGSVHAAYATLVALYRRRRTGRGAHVDVSLQDVLTADPFLRLVTRYSVNAEIPGRTGNAQPTTVADTFRCRDGYVRIFCNQPDHWKRLVEWLGNPPELLDPGLENVQARLPLRPLVNRLVEERTSHYTVEALFVEFQAMRLAASPINAPSGFLRDEQTRHRGFIVETNHAHLGRHAFPADPYRFSEAPSLVRTGAPLLGADRDEITVRFSGASEWLQELRSPDTTGARFSFDGVRIVSFPTGIVGPALGSLLADHGAEVISVEPVRNRRAPQPGQRFQVISDLESHRDKRRVTLNMKTAEGLELARKLIGISDVVAENFSARVMKGWGLDYPRLKAIRGDIIMASLQAFGQTGPRSEYVSFGPILMAFSGMTYLWRDPEVERPGSASQTAFPDYIAPSYGALAIAAALHYRARTGAGQHIDLSQAETAAGILGPAYLEYLINARDPEPAGNGSSIAAPHGCYRCAGEDRWCVIAIESEEQWTRFCDAAGHQEWTADPRFANLSARLLNGPELDRGVESWTRRHTPHQVMMILQRAGVAAGAVQTAEDLYRDPHLRERGSAREVYLREAGSFTRVAPSARLSESPAEREDTVHRSGEDNEFVFGALLGLSTARIDALVERGILG